MSPGPAARAVHGGLAPLSAERESGATEGHTSTDLGSRTIGRYALHAEIAAGGMATVHIGRLLGPVGFARTVAIKRLHPPLAKDPEFVAMFLDEARLAARIRHPNVVSTLDVVATEGELFVVMEYVPGESLARLLRVVRTNKEMVPVPIAATILVGVLHGLHAAHEARDERGEPLRIVHRDVSPHNILVGTDGDAHVIDFGIAKARGRMQVTRQGQIKGKLSYMPSEQLLGQPLDHRADIFAASIVLWEALTGQRLFQGVDDGDVYAKVLLGKVDPPSLHSREVSPELDAIVLRGLARDRSQRYATARDMALALEAVVPLAPPSQVGRWVEQLVGDSLAERTEQIAGIERLADTTDAGMTASPVLTFGGVLPLPAHVPSDGTGTRPARLDRTAPTQPVGMRAAAPIAPAAPAPGAEPHPTVVDRPAPLPLPGDSLAAVSSTPPRRSRRLLAVVLALIPLAGYGALRLVQGQDGEGAGVTAAASKRAGDSPSPAVKSVVAPLPALVPIPLPPAGGTPSGTSGAAEGWTPVPVAVQSVEVPAPAAGAVAAKPVAALPSARPPNVSLTPPPPPASAARPPASNGTSCDPPFYIDADGTKRYKRSCANL